MQCRLTEAEETIESLNTRVVALEKTKQKLSTELEDMQLEVERNRSLENSMLKRQKNFDKIVQELKSKADDLHHELDGTQKECRNYSTELFRYFELYFRGCCTSSVMSFNTKIGIVNNSFISLM